MIGGIQGRTGIEHDHFGSLLAVLGLAPAKRIADQLQRSLRPLDRQAMQALALHAKVFGLDPVFGDLVILQFGHEGRRGEAELVQAVLGMHHQHMLAAQALQHFGQGTAQGLGEHPDHLVLHTGRIRKRAKHVEQGAQPQVTAWASGVLHGAVVGLGEHEADPQAVDAAGDLTGVRFR